MKIYLTKTGKLKINTWCLSKKGRRVAAVVYCFIIVAAVIGSGLRSIVSIVCSIVLKRVASHS